MHRLPNPIYSGLPVGSACRDWSAVIGEMRSPECLSVFVYSCRSVATRSSRFRILVYRTWFSSTDRHHKAYPDREGLYIVAAISAADDLLVNRISQSSLTHIQCSVHHDLQCWPVFMWCLLHCVQSLGAFSFSADFPREFTMHVLYVLSRRACTNCTLLGYRPLFRLMLLKRRN